jgi:hypothetical protein
MTDSPGGFEKKKVDESWKERAQREKEALEKEKAASAGGEATGKAAAEAPAEETRAHDELPPVTFLGFIAGIAAQASVYLGLVENPFTGKKEDDLDAAKHVIDTVAMLKEKTQGNLTDSESGYLDDLLYGLRMEYVKRRK